MAHKHSNTGPGMPSPQPAADEAPEMPAAPELLALADLLSDERDAALKALAGRLAHQLRNPLAAVRAACSGLKEELTDPEQTETLDLCVAEVDRMLGFVSATVHSLPEQIEAPDPCDLRAELMEVVDILRINPAMTTPIHLDELRPVSLKLPRQRLKVALYSLLSQLAELTDISEMRLVAESVGERARISVTLIGGGEADGLLSNGMMSASGWAQPVGLLVAERFARDMGGALRQRQGEHNELIITMEFKQAHG